MLDPDTQQEMRQALMDLEKADANEASSDGEEDADGYFIDPLKDMPTKNSKTLDARLQEQARIDVAKIGVIHEALQKGIELDPNDDP